MAWIALTNKMADTRVSSRQLAYAYQKFVTEISRSETSGRIYNLCFGYEICQKSRSQKLYDYEFCKIAYSNNTALGAKMANLVLASYS